MTFNSLEFLAFFTVCFAIYSTLPHRLQNRLLLVASYIFYAAWDWRFLSLLLISTVVDYSVGQRLATTDAPAARRRLVAVSIVTNIGILGIFKYAGFFASSLTGLMGLVGITLPSWSLDIVLPVGISFYTFQTLSYTIDVYRGRLEPSRGFLDFALYVSFFPQLVAGPIERSRRLLPQIESPRRITWRGIGSGARLALWGLYKKVVIADNLAPLVNAVYTPGGSPTGAEILIATYAFAWQIYCDFSGYSDIARGIARMMGFELMLNFNLPFLAVRPSDIWNRWHISLSSWIRDYLFIPLGGSSGSPWKIGRTAVITMALCGLWHGAGWNFVLWGIFHGLFMAGEIVTRRWTSRLAPTNLAVQVALWAVQVVLTFHVFTLSLVIFRAESMAHLGGLLQTLLSAWSIGLAASWIQPILLIIAPLLVMQALQAWTGNLEIVERWPLVMRSMFYVVVISLILLLGVDGGPTFFYFQF